MNVLWHALSAGLLSAIYLAFQFADAYANGEHVAPSAAPPSFFEQFSRGNMFLLGGLVLLLVIVVIALLRIVRWATRA